MTCFETDEACCHRPVVSLGERASIKAQFILFSCIFFKRHLQLPLD